MALPVVLRCILDGDHARESDWRSALITSKPQVTATLVWQVDVPVDLQPAMARAPCSCIVGAALRDSSAAGRAGRVSPPWPRSLRLAAFARRLERILGATEIPACAAEFADALIRKAMVVTVPHYIAVDSDAWKISR